MKLCDYCGGRFPAGLFYLDRDLWTDSGVRQAAETGADFLVSVESADPLITLCEKYRIGIISNSNIAPFWWGGEGQNAGGYEKQFPLSTLDGVRDYPLSEIIWGDYIVDEPSSMDFPHINRVIARYRSLFPDKLPLVNLYPNYGNIPGKTNGEIMQQLGNRTYAEHIGQYVREIDLPYLCFDYYPFTGVFSTYLENLDTAARACRKSGREMWVVIQTGAWKAEDIPGAHQIDWQVYLCLAYGARAIMCACYSKGWWDETTSCVNLKGEKNITCDFVTDIFSVLHSPLGTEFLKYDYLCTMVHGDTNSSDTRIRPQLEKQNMTERPPDLPDVRIGSDRAIVTGYFRNKDGCALMMVNSHNPFDSSVAADVKIEAYGFGTCNVFGNAKNENFFIQGNGSRKTELKLQSGRGVFVTLGFD